MKLEDYITETKIKKMCDDCYYLLKRDEGYSDYTVTDVEYSCLKNAPYSKEKLWGYEEITVENKCKLFKRGTGIHINVEFSEDDFKSMNKDEAFHLANDKGLLPYKLEDLI